MLRLAAIGLAVGFAALCLPGLSRAEEITSELAERLTPDQLRIYEQYHKARTAFDRQLQAYWRAVDSKRDARRPAACWARTTPPTTTSPSSRPSTAGRSCRPRSPRSSPR